MTPQPLEGVQSGPMAGYLPAAQEGGSRMNTISLAVLIDFIIQRTYHDLTVLAELLPRKTDMERKIEIYNFSARTRQLFIRLIALVKWANSVSKVDRSANIMSFLDKQNMLFVETADMLARMSRETLVRACLPNFHIPAAVEVLTTGTYNRLPSCIRERILPPEPITAAEKKQTMLRLNQVIQHRLVSAEVLKQMREFKIKNGRVTFEVKREFSVALTVMGDGPHMPWRLLDINILVEDKETGDGKSLVHPLQVNYIHQLIQARLLERPHALDEVYHVLHFFCQSLQLEVLYTQSLRLSFERLDDNIYVEEYVPGNKLTVSYWREFSAKNPKGDLIYRLTVESDNSGLGRSLAVIHVPSLGPKDTADIAKRSVRSEHLSMERLIVHTIYIRSVSRLQDLKKEFQEILKDIDLGLQGTPAILTVPVLTPCLRAEQIHITIDTHTGMFRCHVPKHLECSIALDLQDCLNSDHSNLAQFVSDLRFWITHRRCEKTLEHLPATACEVLPYLILPHKNSDLLQAARNKLFVKLHRHPNVVVVVELKEKQNVTNEMEYKFYLCIISFQANEAEGAVVPAFDTPKLCVKLQRLIEFDTFAATHGPGTDVEATPPHKRRVFIDGPPAKVAKTIYPAYFVPELAHVIAMCDEKIPFLNLAEELTKRQVPHSGLQLESNCTSLVLKILALPMPKEKKQPPNQTTTTPKIEPLVWRDLMKRLLSVSIRSQMNKNNQVRIWVVEFIFFSTPLMSSHKKEQNPRRTVFLTYEQSNQDVSKTVDDLLKDWARIVYLYNLVYYFAEHYNNKRLNLADMVSIKSYSYTSLLLGYGLKKDVTCNIYWSAQANGFCLTFVGAISGISAHSIVRDQLTLHLNRHHCLAQLVQILSETYSPLAALAKLPIIPLSSIPRPLVPMLSFSIIPQSPCCIRLTYQAMYCLEIRFQPNKLVTVRDGAYSRFDRNLVDDLLPIQGLKSFLLKYVDETAICRGRSFTDDDNPLSPMCMDDNFSGPGSVPGTGTGSSSPFLSSGMRGPQSPRDGNIRFPAPHTPSSGSNPHTPTSPHPAGGNAGASGSNHPNYNLTSPPNTHMPHPSPGGLMPSSPLNLQPSPHMVHSPGPNNMYMQNHQDQSFSAMSPANSNWPGSPSMPRPSPRPGQSPEHKSGPAQSGGTGSQGLNRMPIRNFAGALPIVLTHEALETLCRPCPNPNKDIPGAEISPLERFLGCAFMRRQLHRTVQNDDNLTPLNSTEAGVVLFKVDGLQCQAALNQMHMQSLMLKVTQIPPGPQNEIKPFQLNADDLQVIEQFFETRVVVPPYRPNALSGFCRILNCAPQVLKDFVHIMRLELKPDIYGEQVKWAVQLCMRVPPTPGPIVPIGSPGVVIHRLKILFFLQITRIPYNGKDWKDSPTLVLPVVYDLQSNITQLAERREQGQAPAIIAASNLLRRFADYGGVQHSQCSLFPAIRDLLVNLQLPNEMPAQGPNPMAPMAGMHGSPMQQQQQMGQMNPAATQAGNAAAYAAQQMQQQQQQGQQGQQASTSGAATAGGPSQ